MSIDSHNRTKMRFDANAVASGYPSYYGTSSRDRREAACLRRAFAAIPAGSKVLDLPCGSGRLLPLLLEHSAEVTGADYSTHMLSNAQQNWETAHRAHAGQTPVVKFVQCDALDTGFAAGEFDAVVCHRLFHHFSEPATRIQALRELSRISRGPVIVSYFNSHALDALKRRLVNIIRRHVPTDRIPIAPGEFRRDIHQAGLRIMSAHPVWRGVSPLWVLVLERREQRPITASERNAIENAA